MKFEDFLAEMRKTNYYHELVHFIKEEYKNKICYPKYENILRAFILTPLDKVKVVIIGQDPYHTPGYAQGLSFSVPNDIKISPSLVNIFKELKDDLGIERKNSDLSDWASKGVLLLNASLSVVSGNPGSHLKYWEPFTNQVIKYLERSNQIIVYILWGNYARNKKELITNKNHYIIESSHPSPLGAFKGFFGSKPFSRCNQILKENYLEPIEW